jgi:alcohol dehydrogenase class IV
MFEFVSAGKIVFGRGSSLDLGKHCAPWMSRALVVVGKNPERHATLLAALAAAGIEATVVTVSGEPTIERADELTHLAKRAGCNGVVSIGGGSVIDAAKAVAALVNNPGGALRYVEVIGDGAPLSQASLPHVAVPTTSGTGAEVTKNAVLGSTERAVKVSLRSNSMLPVAAIVDSGLCHSLPPGITAATGLDALTQVIEPFLSPFANRFTDALCRQAIALAPSALRRAVRDGSDVAARDDMAFVSVCGGLALANAKLGSVHGLAGPLGGMFDAHHGALCGRLLPAALRVNLEALRARAPDGQALARYRELSVLLTGNGDAPIEAGLDALAELAHEVGTVPLRNYGLTDSAFDEVVTKALNSSSMKGNPIALTRDEVASVLRAAS